MQTTNKFRNSKALVNQALALAVEAMEEDNQALLKEAMKVLEPYLSRNQDSLDSDTKTLVENLNKLLVLLEEEF